MFTLSHSLRSVRLTKALIVLLVSTSLTLPSVCSLSGRSLQAAPTPNTPTQAQGEAPEGSQTQLSRAAMLQQRAISALKNSAYDEALGYLKEVRELQEEPLTLFLIAKVQSDAQRCLSGERAWAEFMKLCGSCELLSRAELLRQKLATSCLATLQVTGEPAGALISINGEQVGQAPLTLKRAHGSFDLKVVAPGHSTQLTMLSLAPQQTLQHTYLLKAQASSAPQGSSAQSGEGQHQTALPPSVIKQAQLPPAPTSMSGTGRALLIGGGLITLGGALWWWQTTSELSRLRDEALLASKFSLFQSAQNDHKALYPQERYAQLVTGLGLLTSLSALFLRSSESDSLTPSTQTLTLLPTLKGGALSLSSTF